MPTHLHSLLYRMTINISSTPSRQIEIETKFVNEGFVKMQNRILISSGFLFDRGSQQQNSGKLKPKPKPSVKIITKLNSKPKPSKIVFQEADAEAEANRSRMFGSRSRPGSQHFRKKGGFRKPRPKPKPASNPTLLTSLHVIGPKEINTHE